LFRINTNGAESSPHRRCHGLRRHASDGEPPHGGSVYDLVGNGGNLDCRRISATATAAAQLPGLCAFTL